MEKQLLHSSIRTPDGTILTSKHRHDYVSYVDKNGLTYSLDGGTDYIRTSINVEKAEDLSLYSDDAHEKLREVISRGGRGKNGDEELNYVLLKDINDEWLEAIIEYEELNRPNNKYLPVYREEVKFREQ